MLCTRMSQVYTLMRAHELPVGNSDLLTIVCGHCNDFEVCPSMSDRDLSWKDGDKNRSAVGEQMRSRESQADFTRVKH